MSREEFEAYSEKLAAEYEKEAEAGVNSKIDVNEPPAPCKSEIYP